jgi:glycosyltransferase involved in cell wall biosynthesis
MKVCFVTSEYLPFPGGIATYVSQSALASQRLGHDVYVLVLGGQGADLPKSSDGLTIVHIDQTKYHPVLLPFLAFKLFGQEHYRSADLVIACDIRCAILMNIARPKSRQQKVAVLHGTELVARLLETIHKIKIIKPLALFDRIVTNSEFTKQLAISTAPYIKEDTIRASPLGIDATHLKAISTDEVRAVREKWLTNGRSVLVISVGRQEPRKGFEYSIAAINELPKEVRDKVCYRIIGKATKSAYSVKIAELVDNSVADIELMGVLDSYDLKLAFRAADIFLHSAVSELRSVEGFGLVLLEASAASTAVIATHVDAIPEVVIDGESGKLVAPRDVGALTATILEVVESSKLRENMQVAAEFYSQRFTWEKHVAAYYACDDE